MKFFESTAFLRALRVSLWLLLAPVSGNAQDDGEGSEVPASATDGSVIVVQGEREKLREAARKFTEKITRHPRLDKPLEKFRLPVCPFVYGLKEQYGDRIRDRILSNARDASVRTTKNADCRPNVYVLFVRDVESGLEGMKREGGPLFEMLLEYQIDRVLNETGPVRAWNVAEIRDERGQPIPYDPKTRMYINQPGAASRLRLPITMETTAAIVVIDISALPGKSLTQLADYATMRVLAPTYAIDDPAQAPFDSILSLFAENADDAPPAQMTEFDRIYLRTLYNFPDTLRPDDMYSRVAMQLERNLAGE